MEKMDLHEFMQKFVAKGSVDKMWRTEPGRLARAIDRMLYSSLEKQVALGAENGSKSMVLCVPEKVSMGKLDGQYEYRETARFLHDVQAYLEAAALKEVLGGE